MKKLIIFLILFIAFVNSSFAAYTPSVQTGHSVSASKESLLFFSGLSRQDFEQLTGRKLNLVERIAFKVAQKQVKKELKKEASSTNADVVGGFILGFLFSLIGVLIVYIFGANKTVKKWTWIGAGTFILLLLFIAVASSL